MQNDLVKRALILVDIQNDFCEGGSLAVPFADEIIPIANQIQHHFHHVIATKDWHPKNHGSFATNHAEKKPGEVIELNGVQQILWPEHCVQDSKGSEFHPLLDTHKIEKIIYKGTDPLIDSYSAFFDNAHLRSTGLHDYLQSLTVKEIFIMGLATDYCVKFTCLDALGLGYQVNIIPEGCRAVLMRVGDDELAIQEMCFAGAGLSNVRDF